jgi:hypothetical protein
MEKYVASAKEYLMALLSYPSYLKLLDNNRSNYQPLLKWLIDNFPLMDDDYDQPLPYMKEIGEQFNLNGGQVKNQLMKIYNDVNVLNHERPELFMKEGTVLCQCRFNYFNKWGYFNVGLNFLPRERESFRFYFMKPKVGTDSFYVKRVDHNINDNRNVIEIFLDGGITETLYYQLLKEKALFYRRIGYDQYYSYGTNYKLEDTIRQSMRGL